jgi:hypothetical protein
VQFKILGALVQFKILGAFVELKLLGAFASGLGFNPFESFFLCFWPFLSSLIPLQQH